MKFAKWVFMIAGMYGILVVAPMYFMEESLGRDFPPPITHPEYYYGFVGVTLAWQILFLVIAKNPAGLRLAMVPAIIEKVSYAIATVVLFAQQRITALTLSFGVVDLVLGILFVVAFVKTKTTPGHTSV